MTPIGNFVFLALLATIPLAHAYWCWTRGVYHARSLRVVRAESPFEFWFWMISNLFLGGAIMFAAAATILGKGAS